MNIITLLALPLSLLLAAPAADKGAEPGQGRGKMAQLDTNGDGAISKAEAEGSRLEAHFSKIDANADGSLSKAELKAAHEARKGDRAKGHHGKHERKSPEEMFAKADANSDGKVTLPEMEAAKKAHDKLRAEKGKAGKHEGKHGGKHADKDGKKRTPAERFAKLDANGDGGVTLAEMKAAHAAHHDKKGKGGAKSKSGGKDKPAKKVKPAK